MPPQATPGDWERSSPSPTVGCPSRAFVGGIREVGQRRTPHLGSFDRFKTTGPTAVLSQPEVQACESWMRSVQAP
jgi:hypothetical protein